MNAFSCPSTFLTRSMHACTSSRAEISFERTRRAASAIVNSFSMLFDDFRNQKQAVGFGWRVAQRLFVWKRRARFVGASDIDERDGVGGRFDIAHVELIELLDIAEDLPELRSQLLL